MFILCSLLSDLRPDTAHQVGSLVLLSASQRHWIPILCPSQISLYPSVHIVHISPRLIYSCSSPSFILLLHFHRSHLLCSRITNQGAVFHFSSYRPDMTITSFIKTLIICGSSFMKPFQVAAWIYSSLYIAPLLLQDCYYCYLDDTFTTSLLIREFQNQRKVKP